MSSRELTNKPLVEAILEIRWALNPQENGGDVDPHYRLLLGRLFDRLQSDYPEHEQLDAARLPDDLAGHVVQHRFRAAKDDWPLVQLGPGVFTVNDTSRYKWEDFEKRVVEAKNKLFESYPNPEKLKIESISLRYIDAVELDFQSNSVF